MSKETFKTQYGPAAKRAADKLKVPEDVVLAHWALETGWGKSVVPGTNNLGNIKDFAGGGVAAKDNLTGTTDKYRVFGTPEEFADHYADLILRKHPGAVGAQTGMDFGKGLRATGYMEDQAAPQKLARILKEPVQDEPLPTPDPRAAALTGAIRASIQRPLPINSSKARIEAEVATERSDAELRAEVAPTLWESFAGAVAGNTDRQIYQGITERIWGPKHAPEAGYAPDFEVLKERTGGQADRDLVEDFGKTRSKAEADELLSKYDNEQMRQKTVMAQGLGVGLGMSFLSEIPAYSNILPGVGVAKALARAKMGSQFIAAEGAGYARVAGAAITENALSGTAVELARQGITGDYSLADFGLSLLVDSTIGAAAAGLDVRTASNLNIAAAAERAMAREFELHSKAVAQLGPDASSAEIKQVVERIAAEEVTNAIRNPVLREPALKLNGELALQQDAPRAPGDGQAIPADQIATPTSRFATQEQLAQRELDMAKGGKYEDEWAINTGGRINSAEEFKALGKGVHILGDVPKEARVAVETVQRLAKAFLPNHTVTLNFDRIDMGNGRFANGAVVQTGREGAMIRIDPTLAPSQIIRSTAHEVGHVVFNSNLSKAKIKDVRGVMNAWKEFAGEAQGSAIDGNKARGMRFSALNTDQFPTKEFTTKLGTDYELDFDEYLAEQFVKYMEKDLATDNKFGLSRVVVNTIKEALARVLALFKKVNREVPNVDMRVSDFLDNVLANVQQAAGEAPLARGTGGAQQLAVSAQPADVVAEVMNDPDALRYGITIAPMATAMERKQAQAMLALHKKAEAWAQANPKDAAWDTRAKNLADNNVYSVASAGMIMLKSESPLLRMIASELVEDASGISGKRNSTAAISKYITERFMLGNAINDVEGAYSFWSKGRPGGIKDDLIGGKNRAEFDRLIASEIEARRDNRGPLTQDPNVKAAADSLEAAYQRIANEQRRVQTLGWEGLPESSKGYMPHRMSAKRVINMTNEQSRILHDALVEQFVSVEGWDMSFSDKLASTYIKRVRDRASGDYGSSFGGNSSAESMVEEALRGMDLPEDVVEGHMKKFRKGGASFTKGRIELDLNRPYPLADGTEFKLLDIFETNQIELLRSQAGRASGEVALTKHGVQGQPGLKLLRDALAYGEDGKRANVQEQEAFDQMAAEFMNEPFGSSNNRFLQRAMMANTLVRLGGIAFNQLAESFNGAVHVGVGRTLASIGSIKRLRAEIIALSKGQKVDNPFLSSIELSGAEFGTDAYKVVTPYDSPDHAYPTYGQDTLTLTDRLLRGGTHLQSVVSGWRMIHSAQQRGMAEQIVHKMMRYIREGKDDVALEQFGINARVRAQLRADLPNIATFNGNTLTRFDVTKISDPDIRDEVIQAVWRGTSQIIQGTYIGEKGKWAHEDWGKVMTQFRTFSLTSMEKQWGRQRNSRGAYAAFGILMGSMAMAAPVYMARVYASSIGREDQEEYLAERLETQAIARATLNYVAMSGMAGDMLDLLSAALPEEMGIKPTGGRAGVESTFVGNYVAPAASLVDDIWKYAQSPMDLNDAAKIMPMSRLPYLVPLLNEVKE